MIVLNTPHNPVGKVFTRKEIEAIADIAKEFNLLVMSDEVVRISIPSDYGRSDTTSDTVRLFGVRWRGARADRNSSRDVGENGHSWFCRE